ncbi:flavin monoamine oxidase family protein [Dactylosporangium sp. CA-233914]|uniref:flavin monoamine oxidase family protein n=1 Tax=Dactylosporangium sp. CA-233914 TaxID=3239934 RepID=UPI003D91D49C
MIDQATTAVDYDVVVVGGGIAGLVAAWQLRDYRVLLLEADNRVGGRIKSVQHNGYWANVGAQLFPHAETEIGRLAAEFGVEVRKVPGSVTAIGLGNRIVSPPRVELLPFVLKLSPLERLSFMWAGLKVALGVRGANKVEAMPATTEADEHRRRVALAGFKSDQTFAEYVSSARGRARQVLECIAHRSAADADDVSAGSALLCCAHVMGPRDAVAATASVVVGGTEQVVLALRDRLGGRIVTGAEVTEVADRGDHVVVSYAHGGAARQVTALTTVVATTTDVTRQIVADLPPELDKALDAVKNGAFLSMAIFTDEETPLPIDDIYAITTPGHEIDFLFNHANVLRTGARKPGGSLMCYRGGRRAAELAKETDEVIRDTYLRSVYDLVPALRGHVVKTVVQRWPVGTIWGAPGPDRALAQPALDRGFDHDRIVLAGDYFEPMSGMEPAAKSGVRAAQRVRRALPQLVG